MKVVYSLVGFGWFLVFISGVCGSGLVCFWGFLLFLFVVWVVGGRVRLDGSEGRFG